MRLKPILTGLGVVVLVAVAAFFIPRKADGVSAAEALDIAVDAYIYGYPLVTFDAVRQQETNVDKPDDQHAPINQMILMRSYPAVDNHCCAAPNADTLYTMAWLEVSAEPMVVSVPAMGNRYFILPFVDGWSEVFGVASAPLNGGDAQTYAVTGPGWSGTLPSGVTELKSPTGLVWLLGRLYSDGSEADYSAVHAVQDKFKVTPLSAWGQDYDAPAGKIDPGIDMKTGVREQVNALDTAGYFNRLASLMMANPPTAADAAMIERMARIGLVPGKPFDGKALGMVDSAILATVPKLALVKMGVFLKEQKTTNGWLYFTKGVGNWGTDYLLRGMGNLLGPGWNRPEDAVYPLSEKDGDGKVYEGDKYSYTITFPKGGLPPAKAFWSLTMYDTSFFFVPNPINRYEISQRDTLAPNADGSITLYLQADSPGADNLANWLPAPKGKFSLVLRLYDPAKPPGSILDSSWTPPPVVRVEK